MTSQILPRANQAGNRLSVEKIIQTQLLPLPDLANAPLGARLRFLRKRRRLTLFDLARITGVSHNAIARLERGEVEGDPAQLGKILAFFGTEASEVLSGGRDLYDHLIPVSDFGSWLRNFRLRHGFRQTELAKELGVHKVTLCRYEKNAAKPDRKVLLRLKRRFKLNGQLDRFL